MKTPKPEVAPESPSRVCICSHISSEHSLFNGIHGAGMCCSDRCDCEQFEDFITVAPESQAMSDKTMISWRCCDCRKFVRAGVLRCLSCSIDHGAIKRYSEIRATAEPVAAPAPAQPAPKDELADCYPLDWPYAILQRTPENINTQFRTVVGVGNSIEAAWENAKANLAAQPVKLYKEKIAMEEPNYLTEGKRELNAMVEVAAQPAIASTEEEIDRAVIEMRNSMKVIDHSKLHTEVRCDVLTKLLYELATFREKAWPAAHPERDGEDR